MVQTSPMNWYLISWYIFLVYYILSFLKFNKLSSLNNYNFFIKVFNFKNKW